MTDNKIYQRNLDRTIELIGLCRSLRIAAIRKKFPVMSEDEAGKYFLREVLMIKDALLDEAVKKMSAGDAS